MYLIRCVADGPNKGLFWSNKNGWGDIEGCDVWLHRDKFELPIDSEWVSGIDHHKEAVAACASALLALRGISDALENGEDPLTDEGLWPFDQLRDVLKGYEDSA